MSLRDGEPCSHRGCLNHVTHPCEGCGRVAGRAPKATPPQAGDWVAEIFEGYSNPRPRIAKVKQTYEGETFCDLVIYDSSGKRLGRVSDPCGGANDFRALLRDGQLG